MTSLIQSESNAKGKPLTRVDRAIIMGFALLALWMILDAILFNGQRTSETLATNAKANYCDGAPECYMVGEDGLEFGYLLDSELGTDPYKKPWNIVDLDRLAHAISHAETSHCTKGVGVTHNNCFGIRYNGKFARYKTIEDSFADFKRVWTKESGWYKGRYPDWFLADKWTGGDHVATWLNNVSINYKKPL